MNKLKITTSSVKIRISQYDEIITICLNKGIRKSDFFINAIKKAIKIPYTGHLGVEKLRFQPFGGPQKEGLPSYHMIGARISAELKTQVLVICKQYSITESQFYRWAMDKAILHHHNVRKTQLQPIFMPKVIKKSLRPLIMSPVQQAIEECQKNALETYQTAHAFGNIAGLLLAFVIRDSPQ
ncbi:MAG: hypothetical protein WCP61_09675 [Chitinophagia bacterium]